jgi:hypothetical protein
MGKKHNYTKKKRVKKGGASSSSISEPTTDDSMDDLSDIMNETRTRLERSRSRYEKQKNIKELQKTLQDFREAEYNKSKLPNGWEIQTTSDGLPYYVDHNSKTTHWNLPDVIIEGDGPGTSDEPPVVATTPFLEPEDIYSIPMEIKGVRGNPFFDSMETSKCKGDADKSLKIIAAHGSLIPYRFFKIPEGVKIITLSPTNVCINAPPDINDVEPIMKHYIDGNTIFQNDDNTKKLEPSMDTVMNYYRKLGERVYDSENIYNFQYGLHLPGELFNETKVQLSGEGCEKRDSGGFNCSIICLQKGSRKYSNFHHFKVEGKDLPGVMGNGVNTTIRLSSIIERMGRGTYVLFTCRYFEGDDEAAELTKMFSDERLPGYSLNPELPLVEYDLIPGKKLHTLETLQPQLTNKRDLQRLLVYRDEDNEIKLNAHEQTTLDWYVLQVWLNSNGFDFNDIRGDNNKRLLLNLYKKMDNGGIIRIHDIIRVEIIEKDNDEVRVRYFENVESAPRTNYRPKKETLHKLPEVLMKLCGKNYEIRFIDWMLNIPKAIDYSLSKNRRLSFP